VTDRRLAFCENPLDHVDGNPTTANKHKGKRGAKHVSLALAIFFAWAPDMNGMAREILYRRPLRQWSPRHQCIATQLDVVSGKEHHADILKGAANSLGHNRVRLPTFQFEIVDCAFAH
jgi:hypothetical protein